MKAVTQNRCRRVEFHLQAEPGSKVFVAGSFNDWDPTSLPLLPASDGRVYRATVLLPPGRHDYKFVVNGVWHVDPACPDWVPNALGTLNSVVSV